jgi:hypothetical protein
MDNNQLYGTLPPELAQLPSIQTLYVNKKYLVSVANFSWRRVENNQLTGTIPQGFQNLTSLVNLYVQSNAL